MIFSIYKTVPHLADGNTLYSCNKNLAVMFQDLVCDLKNVLNWFRINCLKLILKEFNMCFSEEVYPNRMF